MTDNDSDKFDKTHVALITESWRESAARDLTSAATILGLWSIGYFADSAALEWVGVLMGCLLILVKMVAILKRTVDSRMTPDEARAWLDRHFPRDG